MNISDLCLGIRLKKKLSQVQFATLIGVTPKAILNYEQGYSVPKGEILLKYITVQDPLFERLLQPIAAYGDEKRVKFNNKEALEKRIKKLQAQLDNLNV